MVGRALLIPTVCRAWVCTTQEKIAKVFELLLMVCTSERDVSQLEPNAKLNKLPFKRMVCHSFKQKTPLSGSGYSRYDAGYAVSTE